MNYEEAWKVLKVKDWSAECNEWGTLWAVGPEEEDQTLKVLGMAPTFTEAVEMALRSEVKK